MRRGDHEARLMTRVAVSADVYQWARDRSRIDAPTLERRFPKLTEWEAGASLPTLKQLESFASATYTPVGFLFLPHPPTETVPIPDFRTMAGGVPVEPSANLLDTIYICQQRQEWYRDFARAEGENPLAFVGAVEQGADVVPTAASIRDAIGFDLQTRERMGTWEEALRQFVEQVEAAGMLVMTNGVVGNNTHRKLDPGEFRGFAIADPLAPLIFVNGADTKSGQMFTLAHELGHLWAGQSALSDGQARQVDAQAAELWCNSVAAELLVPIASMRQAYNREADVDDEMRRLARRFKVSTLVILRRIFDIGAMSRAAFWVAYDAELVRLQDLRTGGSGGGNFHSTEAARVSRRFARALVTSTVSGQTLYLDAFKMLGFSKMDTFREFGRSLHLMV
jgi:Zn-dependent peptidase ImmA (M78 family)